ncbi:MAG: protein translocase subunit SecD, partial [Acidobacteriota bacterium]|nr:protein translocase subunit SecD [Acidobacteriota bacterium]
MQRNLTVKTIVIVATILLCIYGIIGIPKSKAELQGNLERNIKLGLDLKGGSHLVLQVQVQDAMKSMAEHTMESLKETLRKENVNFSGMDRNDPQTIKDADSIQVNVHGVDEPKSSAFRNLIAERYNQWILTPVNATDYRMNLKPSELVDIKRRTVEQSIQTISERVNLLGLTEPVVQQHGRSDAEYEILVQLPGVD